MRLLGRLLAERGFHVVIQSCRGTVRLRRHLRPAGARARRRPRHPRLAAPPALVDRRVRHVRRQLPGLRAVGAGRRRRRGAARDGRGGDRLGHPRLDVRGGVLRPGHRADLGRAAPGADRAVAGPAVGAQARAAPAGRRRWPTCRWPRRTGWPPASTVPFFQEWLRHHTPDAGYWRTRVFGRPGRRGARAGGRWSAAGTTSSCRPSSTTTPRCARPARRPRLTDRPVDARQPRAVRRRAARGAGLARRPPAGRPRPAPAPAGRPCGCTSAAPAAAGGTCPTGRHRRSRPPWHLHPDGGLARAAPVPSTPDALPLRPGRPDARRSAGRCWSPSGPARWTTGRSRPGPTCSTYTSAPLAAPVEVIGPVTRRDPRPQRAVRTWTSSCGCATWTGAAGPGTSATAWSGSRPAGSPPTRPGWCGCRWSSGRPRTGSPPGTGCGCRSPAAPIPATPATPAPASRSARRSRCVPDGGRSCTIQQYPSALLLPIVPSASSQLPPI